MEVIREKVRRRVILRSQGEVHVMKALEEYMRLAPFKFDLFESLPADLSETMRVH